MTQLRHGVATIRRIYRAGALVGFGAGAMVGRRVGTTIGVRVGAAGAAGRAVGAGADGRAAPTLNCQRYPPSCPASSRAWMRTSWVPLTNDRTKLTILTRTPSPPISTGIDSPSMNASTSIRSLDPVTRAPMATSPAGTADPGAGCNPAMIGARPVGTAGLAASAGPGDGGGGGAGSAVAVGVCASLLAAESVGGTAFSGRTGVLRPMGRAPSRGRSTARGAHAESSTTPRTMANMRHPFGNVW